MIAYREACAEDPRYRWLRCKYC